MKLLALLGMALVIFVTAGFANLINERDSTTENAPAADCVICERYYNGCYEAKLQEEARVCRDLRGGGLSLPSVPPSVQIQQVPLDVFFGRLSASPDGGKHMKLSRCI
ncbi:hypothetical protein BDV96DRAFT_650738 [Lophiotrema nucula]|uniref:Saposin B-type domain-containing protein n=1 Tax=Lophiotrema nucula TaxID=690887 RepID=A0A6A5YU16_9PLEO|nr:hypothetical protein BDV96DRAFT_650738 [Lophiotrema nucula]